MMVRPIKYLVSGYLETLRKRSSFGVSRLFVDILSGGPEKWPAIRMLYQIEREQQCDFGSFDWRSIMTPIEKFMLEELEYRGIRMRPQYPIGRYFADFADPEKKIVIECDGAEYHDEERDRVRDAFMTAKGWSVYRISGSDCARMRSPWEEVAIYQDELDEQSVSEIVDEWAFSTAEGFAFSLSVVAYGCRCSNGCLVDLAKSVLEYRLSKGE